MNNEEYDVSRGPKVYELAHALAEYWSGKKWKVCDGEITWLDSTKAPTKEEVQAKVDEMNAAEPLRHLRAQRNLKLKETDWWAVSDRTMTDAEKAYRQALRDLPANTKDLANPTFPTKP